ncbi:hypothetical protein [Achromobacter anxifer]|uniref:hypothetical protein n=1 Tax=Achromobacter anxifer TaxID=1287737 RepID=UPI0015903A2D|nr:hypothetical protein [Achromobacter anxifer]
MTNCSKLNTYRLIGLSVCGPFWPMCSALTLGLVMGAGYLVGVVYFGGNQNGLRGSWFSSILGIPFAFFSPALVGIAHTALVRKQYGREVSAALLARFAKLKDGEAPNFSLSDLISDVRRAAK